MSAQNKALLRATIYNMTDTVGESFYEELGRLTETELEDVLNEILTESR